MLQTIYLHLLILCGIWSQGIIGTCADEEIKESSDILVRQKRVVNLIPGEDNMVPIKNRPYVVHIKYRGRIHCVGSILSQHVVITIPSCVKFHVSEYIVVSASALSSRGTPHNITNVIKKYDNHPRRPSDGIALVTVSPSFVYRSTTNYIEIHTGPLLPGTLGTVSGWGYNCGSNDPGTNSPIKLRSIEVPIISHRECVNVYLPHIEISELEICTRHPQKKCGHSDGGAPLVVDGYLAGVYLRTGVYIGGLHFPNYPDVFVMLQHSAYREWIRTNVQNIGLQYNIHHL